MKFTIKSVSLKRDSRTGKRGYHARYTNEMYISLTIPDHMPSFKEQFFARYKHPYRAYKAEVMPALQDYAAQTGNAVLAEVLKGEKWKWSQKCGCTCGCSPGFKSSVHFNGYTIWVTVEVEE